MLKTIKTEMQYEEALERVYNLMQMTIKPNSAESDELELLVRLVQQYELEHFPLSQ